MREPRDTANDVRFQPLPRVDKCVGQLWTQNYNNHQASIEQLVGSEEWIRLYCYWSPLPEMQTNHRPTRLPRYAQIPKIGLGRANRLTPAQTQYYKSYIHHHNVMERD